MIILDLTCEDDHTFEGWFQSLDTFDRQLEAGLIECPHCGSSDIRRVPSAVHVAKSSEPERSSENRMPVIGLQADALAAYRQLLGKIVASSEDVGKAFASEARKIHYQEAPERSIRGEASPEECEALRDEGIEVIRLPVIKKEDLN